MIVVVDFADDFVGDDGVVVVAQRITVLHRSLLEFSVFRLICFASNNFFPPGFDQVVIVVVVVVVVVVFVVLVVDVALVGCCYCRR